MNFRNMAVGVVATGLFVFLVATGIREDVRQERLEQTAQDASSGPRAYAPVAPASAIASQTDTAERAEGRPH